MRFLTGASQVLLCSVSIAACATPQLAQAALGGDLSSVLADHAALNLSPMKTSTENYDVYVGTFNDQELREYVDHTGRVFAVTYRGQLAPQIESLLGQYAARYAAAAQASNPAHHQLSINNSDFSATTARLPRGWRFRADLPTWFPIGVDRTALE